jgi:hypothetical protein
MRRSSRGRVKYVVEMEHWILVLIMLIFLGVGLFFGWFLHDGC